MPRPCRCDRIDPRPGAPWDDTQCRLCWLNCHDLKYQKHWSGAATMESSCSFRASKAHRWAACDCPSGMAVFMCENKAVGGECAMSITTASRERVAEDEEIKSCLACEKRNPIIVTLKTEVSYPCRYRTTAERYAEIDTCDGSKVEVFNCTLAKKDCTLETQVSGAALCAACSYRAYPVAKGAIEETAFMPISAGLEGQVQGVASVEIVRTEQAAADLR